MIGPPILELAAASSDPAAAHALARRLGGTLYADAREAADDLPFRALLTVATDDLDAVAAVADVGCYVVCRRLMKAGPDPVTALFPLIRRSDLTHREADAHWRDVHAPLALEHHAHMTRYEQLSVVQRIAGPELDGFALCAFDALADLRQRFYSAPGSRDVIAADVARFADLERSPRRLIVRPRRFGLRPEPAPSR